MKIGIIACGENRKEWLEHGEFGDWFPPLLQLSGETFSHEVFNAVRERLPDDPRCCDAWLLTGSPSSVLDDLPWQRKLTAFLADVVGRQPVIGICYGHQHLHQMLGGRVEVQADWGVGIHHYDLKALPDWLPDDVAADSQGGFDLIALHRDHVTRPAPGSRIWAGSDFCPAAITGIGNDILTFQPHPEMAPQFARAVYEFECARIGPEKTLQAQQRLAGPRDTVLAARWMMAFLQHRLAAGASPTEERSP